MKTEDIAKAPPSPWIPESDPVRVAILGKIQEELHELGKIISRCIIQGIDEKDPEYWEKRLNRDALAEEIADVENMLNIMKSYFNLPTLHRRKSLKFEYQQSWYNMLSGLSNLDPKDTP